MKNREWMKGANPLSFLDNKVSEPCYVCKEETPLSELAAIHGMSEHDNDDHFGLCKNCIDRLPVGFGLCGCGG